MSKKSKAAKVQPRPPASAMDLVITVVPTLFVCGLRTVASPCVHEDGSAAACGTTAFVLLGMGVVALVLALMRLLGADKATKRSFDLLLLVAGVLIAFSPGFVLGLCDDVTMRCHTILLPFARAFGAGLGVCAVLCEATVDHEEPQQGRSRRRRR